MKLLVKGGNKNNPCFHIGLPSFLSTLKSIICSNDKLHAATMYTDMVLPFALAHSVDSAPFAFQTHGPCLQVLPCSEMGPKVLELVAKSLASAQTEMGAWETGPWSVVGQDPLQGCRGHGCQSVLVNYLPSFYSLNDSQRVSFSFTTDSQSIKRKKKVTLDQTNDTPILYSQCIIF